MSAYRVHSHPVEVARITGLQPLMGRNDQLTSPDVGLILVLEDSTKQKWLSEKDGVIPAAGDWLVKDAQLNTIYVVPAAKFKKLFKRSSKG